MFPQLIKIISFYFVSMLILSMIGVMMFQSEIKDEEKGTFNSLREASFVLFQISTG